MEYREQTEYYVIPANYTDSGKLFGGLLETRNAVETVILVVAIGYPELMLFSMPVTIRIVLMTVTLMPVAVVCMMGVDGDSLFRYTGHVFRFFVNRRKLHFRRVGFRYYDQGKKKTRKKKRK